MKKYKLYPTLLASLLGLVFPFQGSSFSQQSSGNNIDFSINLEKESYVLSEPIWVDVSVKNISNNDINILPLVLSCMECLQVFLINSKSDTLFYHGMVADVTRPPTGYATEPGNTRSNYFNLLESFGEKLDGFGMRRFLKADKYLIVAIYNSGIQSNKIEFEVCAPQRDEKKAHALLKEGYDYQIQMKITEFDSKFEELVTKYPKSMYTEVAYYEMTYWTEDPKDAEKYGKELILKYPDSRFTRFAFWKMLRGKTRRQQIEFLKDILKNIPVDTRAYDWAQGSLKGLEEKDKSEK